MKNWRESNILLWDIFNVDSFYRGRLEDVNDDRGFVTFIWGIFSAFFIVLPAFMTADLVFHSGWIIIPAIITAALVCWKVPELGRKHVLYGLTGEMYDRAKFYYECNEEDRALYPRNIEETFRMDLSKVPYRQSEKLRSELRNLESDIIDRRHTRAKMLEVVEDISDSLDAIADARAGIQSDIQVYKELS